MQRRGDLKTRKLAIASLVRYCRSSLQTQRRSTRYYLAFRRRPEPRQRCTRAREPAERALRALDKMTRKTAKKSKGAKPLQPQMQWALICEAAKHGTYTYLQQCMVRACPLTMAPASARDVRSCV